MKEFKALSRLLQIALGCTFALALGGAFLPGVAGRASSIGCIIVLICAPVFRVVWLVGLWARERDTRFVLLGCALLMVLSLGGAIAIIR